MKIYFMFFLLILSCNLIAQNVQEYFDNGDRLYKEEKYNEAIDSYYKGIALEKNRATIAVCYYNCGLSYLNMNKYNEAIKDFTRSIEFFPEDYTDAIRYRGYCYNFIQKYNNAITDCNKAIELNPNDISSYENLGFAYLGLGNYNNAVDNFKICIEKDSKKWDAMLGLSMTYFKMNNLENTKNYFNMAKDLEPRLKKGMDGITELENDGWLYTDTQKEILKQMFKKFK